ncbi:MAG: hypothetical protein PHQ96_05195 [Candidatus Omnitrophica bacterium]|nr:hypothetical protein [Candidatus Omnitrophota bacterium]
MKKLLLFSCLFLILPFNSAFCLFNRVSGIEDSLIKRIVISSFLPTRMYAASKNSLYSSDASGKQFIKTAVFKDEEIQHIFFDPSLANTLFCATTRHLYKIADKQESLFACPEEAIIMTAQNYKGEIFIGTTSGLYVANEELLKWEKIKILSDTAVYYMAPAKDCLYLATGKGVYCFKNRDNIERLLVIREKEQINEEESGIVPRVIAVDVFNSGRLWLGTNKGIFASSDSGKNWKKLYIEGINSLSINYLMQAQEEEGALFAATAKGFFKINLEAMSSKQIFEGIEASEIFWIAFNEEGEIYLATELGLFKGGYFTQLSYNKDVEALISGEPPIEEIQEASIRYNEVHPDKIRKWRNQLKARALFPTINWSYDKTIYGSSSGTFAVGPRDWGLSFGWDLGDFVWNSYEDDVDTRSRLNTQLRLDILDEINRVYFERLRIKREVLAASPNQEELFQKQLRLKELTAILDGYTGGYFSHRAEELDED